MVMSIEGLDPRRERLVLAYFCRGKFDGTFSRILAMVSQLREGCNTDLDVSLQNGSPFLQCC